MPAGLILALAVLAVALVLRSSIRAGLATYLAVLFLVPNALVIPGSLTSIVTFQRVVLFALAGRLLLGWLRGEIPQRAFRVERIHVAFLLLLAVVLMNGVVLAPGPPDTAVRPWLLFFDQLFFLVVVLAAIRAVGDIRWVAFVVAATFGLDAAMAAGEHFTGHSYARFWFEHLPTQIHNVAAAPLGRRGGPRVRGSSAFALEFSWIAVMVLPVAVVVAATARRQGEWLWRAVPIAIVLGLAWSTSRSTAAGLIVVVLGLGAVALRNRRMRSALAVAVIAGLGFWLSSPGLRSAFTKVPSGSTDVRSQQLPRILEVVSHHPYQGIGLGRLRALNFIETDTSYLQIYSQAGVIGLLAFAILLLVALLAGAWVVRAPPCIERDIGIASLTGMVAGLFGAAAFDQFHVAGASVVFWLLVALSLAARDQLAQRLSPVRVHLADRTRIPTALVVILVLAAGFVGGLGVRRAAPHHTSTVFRIDSVPTSRLAVSKGGSQFLGSILGRTACDIVARQAKTVRGGESRCVQIQSGPGAMEAWISARNRHDVVKVLTTIDNYVHLFGGRALRLGPLSSGPPTPARSAPLWLPLAGLALVILIRTNPQHAIRPVETVALHG